MYHILQDSRSTKFRAGVGGAANPINTTDSSASNYEYQSSVDVLLAKQSAAMAPDANSEVAYEFQDLRSTGSTPTSVVSTGAAATRRGSIQNLQYLTLGAHYLDDQQGSGIAETSFGVGPSSTADEESQHGESAYEYQGAMNNALHVAARAAGDDSASGAATESDYEYQTSVSALLQQQTNHLPKGAIVLDDTNDYITVGQGRDSGDDESDDEFAC